MFIEKDSPISYVDENGEVFLKKMKSPPVLFYDSNGKDITVDIKYKYIFFGSCGWWAWWRIFYKDLEIGRQSILSEPIMVEGYTYKLANQNKKDLNKKIDRKKRVIRK